MHFYLVTDLSIASLKASHNFFNNIDTTSYSGNDIPVLIVYMFWTIEYHSAIISIPSIHLIQLSASSSSHLIMRATDNIDIRVAVFFITHNQAQ